MLTLLLMSLTVFLLAFAGLALGVMFGRKPLRGSCGGLNSPDGGCEVCSGQRCRRRPGERK